MIKTFKIVDEEIVIKQWIHEYLANVDKVNAFYLSQLEDIMNRIAELKATIRARNVCNMYRKNRKAADLCGVSRSMQSMEQKTNSKMRPAGIVPLLIFLSLLDG